jgi:hypothetical protein
MSDSWLHDIVLVNDGPTESEPGDVYIFRNFADACSYLEHWAEEPELGVFSGEGDQLLAEADEHGNMGIIGRQSRADGREVITLWLRRMAEAVSAARRHRAGKRWRRIHLGEREAQGVLPETVEGLIAYIGFTI